MRKEDIPLDLSGLALDFFYWFSRFEFALKENGYLFRHDVGARAQPGWDEFVERWMREFKISAAARTLLTAKPRSQVVGPGDTLAWEAVALDDCRSDLARVVRLLKTIRNNLFHGGKHTAEDWDEPDRTRRLLSAGKEVLDQLARMASLEADYTRYY